MKKYLSIRKFNRKFPEKEVLIILLIILVIASFISIYSLKKLINPKEGFDRVIKSNFDNKKLRISKVSVKIHIDNNWTQVKTAGICTGQGTYSDPYVIEDLIIDCNNSGSSIFIENSNVHFRIENCTLYNSVNISHAGIMLSNVTNSVLTNNNCSSNYIGIYINNSDYNLISGNVVNDNIRDGIHLYNSDYNVIWGNNTCNNNHYGIGIYFSDYNIFLINTANDSIGDGIYLYYSHYNNFTGNIIGGSGFEVHGSLEGLASNVIDITNLVNDKPLYYYTDVENLRPNNFTNAGQVILVNCSDSIISNLTVSHSSNGISLYYCNNNTILKNNVNNNSEHGIYLYHSVNNSILSNNANYNDKYGIYLYHSYNNSISGNSANNNNEYGICISYSNNTTILENTANYNFVGIYLGASNSTTVSKNIIKSNQYGIYLYDSNNCTLSENILISNKIKAIHEENCEGNNITNNKTESPFPIENIILISIIGGVVIVGSVGTIVWRKKIFLQEKEKGIDKLKEAERRKKIKLKETERKEKQLLKKEKILEKERLKKEKEQQKIEEQKLKVAEDLQKRLPFIDNLIKEKSFEIAFKNLKEIQELAKLHNFNYILIEVEKRFLECKKSQVDIINRIKQTIENLSRKFARLQLTDIAEKSAIKDEALIENVILEMIKNKEIHGEYFASSKALALEVATPIGKQVAKKKRELNVFLSYSTLDADYYEISKIVKRLEIYPEINNVFFWEADSGENIVTYMEKTLKKTNVFVLFCSENSMKSKSVEGEWQAAYQLRKDDLMKIVPIYEKDVHIPYLLKPILNVKFTKEDFDVFIEKLYKEILR